MYNCGLGNGHTFNRTHVGFDLHPLVYVYADVHEMRMLIISNMCMQMSIYICVKVYM